MCPSTASAAVDELQAIQALEPQLQQVRVKLSGVSSRLLPALPPRLRSIDPDQSCRGELLVAKRDKLLLA